MTLKLERGLWCWAGALTIALLMIVPMTVGSRTLAIISVAVCIVLVWKQIGKHAARQNQSLVVAGNLALPPASYRQPVVLVCGDGLDDLFGEIPAEQLALRITGEGCYVRVPSLELLPSVTDSLIGSRAHWGKQLSVMFIVNPQEHADREMLAGRARVLRHQMMRVRKRGIALPLFLLSYLQTYRGDGPWFRWEAGQASPTVHEAGACVSSDDWQTQAADDATRASRLETCVRINNVAALLSEVVLPHLTSHKSPTSTGLVLGSAITLVAASSPSAAGNLWQKWLRDKVALVDLRQGRPDVGKSLPFPDPLLAMLPSATRYAPKRRASVIALWLFTAAGLVALVSSAWQNTLLVRQISDDLRRYASLLPANKSPHSDVRHEDALKVLRQDALRLDRYYREGAPLSLGLGLYYGEHLRGHLLAVIAGHRQPSTAVATTIRLDSLSLFDSGSAQLKPDAAKVLINTLVDIKAQPGWLIVIAGHTDDSGNPERNMQLSRARAAAVHTWMRQMGDIPDSCFAVQGFGASQPIASNSTETGRQINRRVDIRLIPEVGACVLPTRGNEHATPVA